MVCSFYFAPTSDNEWNKCPDIRRAKANYTKYFIGIESNWNNSMVKNIIRSKSRPENWVLFYSNVLFLAINMVDASNNSTRENFDETTKRLSDNLQWFQSNCKKYCHDAKAVIIFGHSITNASLIFDDIYNDTMHLNIPLVYFTGNGHNFFVKTGVGKGKMQEGNFWRVQVAQGKIAPPIQVTIRDNYDDIYTSDNHQFALGNMIKIDRRGGTYLN